MFSKWKKKPAKCWQAVTGSYAYIESSLALNIQKRFNEKNTQRILVTIFLTNSWKTSVKKNKYNNCCEENHKCCTPLCRIFVIINMNEITQALKDALCKCNEKDMVNVKMNN